MNDLKHSTQTKNQVINGAILWWVHFGVEPLQPEKRKTSHLWSCHWHPSSRHGGYTFHCGFSPPPVYQRWTDPRQTSSPPNSVWLPNHSEQAHKLQSLAVDLHLKHSWALQPFFQNLENLVASKSQLCKDCRPSARLLRRNTWCPAQSDRPWSKQTDVLGDVSYPRCVWWQKWYYPRYPSKPASGVWHKLCCYDWL